MPDAFDRAPRPAPAPSPLRDALEPWCAAGTTGVLRVLDPPGGAVYLTEGCISYAESAPACGLDRLLTASGRLSAETWRAAVAEGRPGRRVGETLVKQGVITPVELEAEVLAAVFGAGLFLLDAGTEVQFEIGVEHMVGPVVALDLYAALGELERRRRALAEAYADSSVDDHAVVPVRRLPGHNVALTALQWEIVAHADRRRSPMELARSLGARDDGPGEYPVVIETSGAPSAFEQALERVAPGGRVIVVGQSTTPAPVATFRLVQRRLTIRGCLIYDHPGGFASTIAAMTEPVGDAGLLRPGQIVQARFAVKDAARAFDESAELAGKSWISFEESGK